MEEIHIHSRAHRLLLWAFSHFTINIRDASDAHSMCLVCIWRYILFPSLPADANPLFRLAKVVPFHYEHIFFTLPKKSKVRNVLDASVSLSPVMQNVYFKARKKTSISIETSKQHKHPARYWHAIMGQTEKSLQNRSWSQEDIEFRHCFQV